MTSPENHRFIAITGATLIDDLGGPPLADATIVVEDDRFSHVGPSAATLVPEGAEVIDGRAKFVIPGLMDMHVHAGAPDREHLWLFLEADVACGIIAMPGCAPGRQGRR